MSSTEHGFEAGPAPESEPNTFPTFEQMFEHAPWKHGITPDAMVARKMAWDTYDILKRAHEREEADKRLASEQSIGEMATAAELQQMADDQYRGNDNPPLPPN